MRRSRSRVPGVATAFSLAILVACSAPVAPTPTALPSSTPAAPTPTPTGVQSSTPTTPVSTPSPGSNAEGAIDLTSLTGLIVFDDGQDIWSINADGTGLRRLTREPWPEFQPSLSPDGRFIVYRSEPDEMPELRVMNVDGSGQRQLIPEGGFPAWSPDGSMIAYAPPGGASGRSSITVMNADGSGQRPLLDTDYGEGPSWSPDGKRIAFTKAISGERLMYVVEVDGSGVVDLSSAGQGTMLAWSPDGRSIVFASERDHSDWFRDIYAMRPDGSDVRRLTLAWGEAPAWSPDGRYIVFTAQGGFGVMRADGSGTTSVPVAGVGAASNPEWR